MQVLAHQQQPRRAQQIPAEQGEQSQDIPAPCPRYPGRQQEEQHGRGPQQAGAQVVHQLVAVQRAQPRAAERKGQELPVPPCPAVESGRKGQVAGNLAVVEHDIRGIGRPRIAPLQKVVAEHSVFGYETRQRPGERAHIIDAFASVVAFPEQS